MEIIAQNDKTATETAVAQNASVQSPLEKGTTDTAESTTEISLSTGAASGDFGAFMKQALSRTAAENVNEEELFSALIGKKLSDINPDAAKAYEDQKASLTPSMTRSDGYVPVEDIANKALQAAVEAGAVSAEDAARVKSEAFAAAQLDDNPDALYDGRGSENDPTVAIATLEAALSRMEGTLKSIEAGELDVDQKAVTEDTAELTNTTTGAQSLDGGGGFLWKPVSEADGNLVVLLPNEFNDLISKVEIHSDLPANDETKLAEGRFTGDEHNGERGHYRFDKPGAEFGENVQVVAYKTDGSTLTWAIPNGADRQD